MDTFDEGIKKRLGEIAEELREINDRRRKLEAQHHSLAAYLNANRGTTVSAHSLADSASRDMFPIVNGVPLPRPFTPKRLIIANRVQRLLAKRQPQHTRELLTALDEQGIEVGGTDKVLALSAILSRDDRFVPNRKEGWTLNEEIPAVSSGEDSV